MENLQRGLFHKNLIEELTSFFDAQKLRFPKTDVLRMDMHCHDFNSDVPDELIGRILNVPETWISSELLINTLKQNGSTALTITNHNNARSCFEQQEKGIDVLTASEFSCLVPDFNVGIHVLTYGFDRDQEKRLNKLRSNIYDFQAYTKEHALPTIWAHPLYYYAVKGNPPIEFFEKMALVFERFEVINGQRDTWQNMLVKNWVENLTEEKLDSFSKKAGIAPDLYCRDPFKKSMSGGSDSHMGIFSGQTGSELYIPNLQEKLKNISRSQLALQAIIEGNMAPYGNHSNSERMTVAFLDYFCQIALYKKDAGMLRVILHKGSVKDKLLALGVSNAFAELKRHKVTMRFIETFHYCFAGTPPKTTHRWLVSKAYKPVFDEATNIAKHRSVGSADMANNINDSIFNIYTHLGKVLTSRLGEKLSKLVNKNGFAQEGLQHLFANLELPSELRAYLDPSYNGDSERMTSPDLGKFLDGLSFPFLASSVMLAAHFTSTKVLYNTRPLLNKFSDELGKLQHPKRVLWMSDTFKDQNGVAMVLESVLKEIQIRNLPIDILVCSNEIAPQDHLIVIPPLSEFEIPVYKQQKIRVPNFFEIHRLFLAGEYDRIICSTEGPMGLAALYLKHSYSVPAHFYVHTDWMMFARKVLNFDRINLGRFRRLLRSYYGAFDKLLVLNKDQHKWFSSKAMNYPENKVHLTAHWADHVFERIEISKESAFGISFERPIVMFAGRLSKEKGVLELADVMLTIHKRIPEAQLVIAGTGPAEAELKSLLPEALYLGWVNHENLPSLYSAADVLLLPSRFDTFSCVVLESLSCGLPVIAYNTKGPKDIIQHGENGYLVNTVEDMATKAIELLSDERMLLGFRDAALKRAKDYSADKIIQDLLQTIEM